MAVRKAGLGKGLDSLIPEHSVRRKAEKTEQKPEKNELLLKITDIEPNRERHDLINKLIVLKNEIENSRGNILMKMRCWNCQIPSNNLELSNR